MRVPTIRRRDPDPIIAEIIEAIIGPALPAELTGLTDEGRRAIAERMDEMRVQAEDEANLRGERRAQDQ